MRDERDDICKAKVFQEVGHFVITITAESTIFIRHSLLMKHLFNTFCVLEKLSKYCKMGFLNDSINIYSVPFMCWVLEKLNKYCKIGFLNDSRFQPNNIEV